MKIVDAFAVPAEAGFFHDDQLAVRQGPPSDGFLLRGPAVTPGFTSIRQPGRAVSILLVLDDGHVAVGDCATVQYAGAAGRESLFDARAAATTLDADVLPRLVGAVVEDAAAVLSAADRIEVAGRLLHVAVRYGLSQALLDAVAHARGLTMAEVVRDDFHTGVEIDNVPVYAQSGDDRYDNVDKMILKRADVLPHGLINTVEGKLGAAGEVLAAYVEWLRGRILSLSDDKTYRPVLHLDVYGTVGLAFDGDLRRVATYLGELGRLAHPFRLQVEHPVDAGSRAGQIELCSRLRALLRRGDPAVGLVVDEWCNTVDDVAAFAAAGAADVVHVKTPDLGGLGNTVEALLVLRRAGIGGFAGGSCTETDVSARATTHVALGCGASQVLAKPGMGVDEGLMIVRNEMSRTTALVARRRGALAAAGGATSR